MGPVLGLKCSDGKMRRLDRGGEVLAACGAIELHEKVSELHEKVSSTVLAH